MTTTRQRKRWHHKTPFTAHRTARDPIIADFPVTHQIFLEFSDLPFSSTIQPYNSFWTATRVSGWHFGASQRSADPLRFEPPALQHWMNINERYVFGNCVFGYSDIGYTKFGDICLIIVLSPLLIHPTFPLAIRR